MKKFALFFSVAAFVALSAFGALSVLPTAQAVSASESQTVVSEETATFAIEKMTCAACPITVRKAIEGVDGVKKVTVDFDKKTATAIYDPATTTVEHIGAASTNAGYPATPNL